MVVRHAGDYEGHHVTAPDFTTSFAVVAVGGFFFFFGQKPEINAGFQQTL